MKPYQLSEYLQAQADAIPDRRSAESTRLSLLAGAARINESEAHTNMRIPQLCKLCGISRATYYLHFNSKDELLVELMEHLITMERHYLPVGNKGLPIHEAVNALVDWYITLHISNGRLFTNLSILRWSDQKINDLWITRSLALHKVLREILHPYPEFKQLDSDYTEFVIEFVGSGMNAAVSRFVSGNVKNPFIPPGIESLKKSCAKLFYGALFGCEVGTPG
jgi:AcrR family transcriptional regulator